MSGHYGRMLYKTIIHSIGNSIAVTKQQRFSHRHVADDSCLVGLGASVLGRVVTLAKHDSRPNELSIEARLDGSGGAQGDGPANVHSRVETQVGYWVDAPAGGRGIDGGSRTYDQKHGATYSECERISHWPNA